jgi:hypothetical protein
MKEGAAVGKIQPMMARLYFFYVKREESERHIGFKGIDVNRDTLFF